MIEDAIDPAFLQAAASAPRAAFEVFQPATGSVEVTVDGAASVDPDGVVARWAWDFGDGAKGTGVRATHTYTSAGIFYISLSVTDSKGETNIYPAKEAVAIAGDVTLSVSRAPSACVPGDVVPVELRLRNGGLPVTNAAVEVTFPWGLEAVDFSSDLDGKCSKSDRHVYVAYPEIASGGEAAVTLHLRVDRAIEAGTVLRLRAVARINTIDADESDNSITVPVEIASPSRDHLPHDR